VVGATGRMGQLVSHIVRSSDDFELLAEMDSTGELTQMLGADIAVDVTLPSVSQSVVEVVVPHGISVLIGTSGTSPAEKPTLNHGQAQKTTPTHEGIEMTLAIKVNRWIKAEPVDGCRHKAVIRTLNH
jgi:dihydrodipicolinate reductase